MCVCMASRIRPVRPKNSALGEDTDKFNTILERGQIAHEDFTITNLNLSSQESGMSFMSPKGPYGL